MDEVRLLSVLERIASALERLAPAISASEGDLPFDPAEADEYNAARDEEQRDFWAYLNANPEALETFEEAGLSSEGSDEEKVGDSEDEYGEEEQYDDYDDDPRADYVPGVSIMDDLAMSDDPNDWLMHQHLSGAGIDDDFIEDVLDGDPMNYWNID